jgi:hypothetical protein
MSTIEKYSNYDVDKAGNVLILYYVPNSGLKEVNFEHYKLIKYDRDSKLDESQGLFRSVIFSNNQLSCYSPQKSISMEQFKTIPFDSISIEENIEGTMINLFFDQHIQKWVYASKSNIGANCKFYSDSISFHEMYEECLLNSKLKYDELNKQYCYSFVIQHPKNRIVIPFEGTALYLVNVYHCYYKDNLNFVEHIPVDSIKPMFSHSDVQFPKTYTFEMYDSITMPESWFFKGYMLKTDFYRCKLINPNYEHIKELRGNQPNYKYYYLMLRKNETILKEFLNYYPEYSESSFEFEKEIKQYTSTLFKYYISCFIHKSQKLKDYPPKYKTHMYHLHQIYITTLSPEKKYVTYLVTEKYINELHPSQLMFSLNYELHKPKELVILHNDSIEKDYFIIS